VADIKAGDTVGLKSGGPAMTAEKIGNEAMTSRPKVWCSWFDHKNVLQHGSFAPEMLLAYRRRAYGSVGFAALRTGTI
jgi:uncharacterized protein YodC (DUF2158 family)